MKKKNYTVEKQQRKNEYKNASRYIVYLIKVTLNQMELKESPVNCSWETIWDLVEKNYIEALIGNYIQKYEKIVPTEIRNAGNKSYNETLYRQVCFDIERENVQKNLEDQKLSYLMLKGINISKYYPQAGTRWMSDNDILCGYIQKDENRGYRAKGETNEEIQYWKEKACVAIQTAMENSGFSLKDKGASHDSYIKLPMVKFEMHHQLFLRSFDETKAKYYQNPWKKAIPDKQRPYLYHYAKEDEYIYLVTHAYKHFSRSGTGIRTLIDIYVFLKNNTDMNRNYILEQLQILKLEDFEALLRNTAIHVFSIDGQMTSEEWDTVFYMIGSGIYGTSLNRIKHSLEEKDLDGRNSQSRVWHYMKDRLWLNESMMKEYFPFFYRHRHLRPIMPLYRIIKGILIHPKKIWTEWRILFIAAKNK